MQDERDTHAHPQREREREREGGREHNTRVIVQKESMCEERFESLQTWKLIEILVNSVVTGSGTVTFMVEAVTTAAASRHATMNKFSI